MIKNKMFVRYQAADAETSSQNGQTEVNEDTAIIVVPVKFNAKYKKLKDAKGNVVKDSKGVVQYEMVKVTTGKDEKGADIVEEQKAVETPAKTVKANVTVTKFDKLTPDILVSLYNSRVEKLAIQNIKSESAESLLDGAEFSYTLSPADLIGESVEVSDELLETAKTAFMQFLATQGKSEKAQKNNSILLGSGITKLSTTDKAWLVAYEANLTKFVEASSADLLMEIEPVISQANYRLEKAKNQDIGGLI